MACVAEFGIIDEFDEYKDYSEYEPQKYNCVAIEDDFLDDWWDGLKSIKTYFHTYSRPECGLARWGVTLIPPQSLDELIMTIMDDSRSKSSPELIALIRLLGKALIENKYVIHYGV